MAAILSRPRIVRVIQQPARERILFNRLIISDDAGHEPTDGVDDHERGEFPPGQYVIADRHFFGGHVLAHTVIDAFVSSAQHNDMFEQRKSPCIPLRKRLSLQARSLTSRRLGT